MNNDGSKSGLNSRIGTQRETHRPVTKGVNLWEYEAPRPLFDETAGNFIVFLTVIASLVIVILGVWKASELVAKYAN